MASACQHVLMIGRMRLRHQLAMVSLRGKRAEMSAILDKALEELKLLPKDAQDAIAHDLLEMIRSEQKWDELFVDPRSEALLKRLASEADADGVFDFDPATRPGTKAAE